MGKEGIMKCTDCGRHRYDDEGCDCTKCVVCDALGDEDFCSVLDGEHICDACLEEKTGLQLGVTAGGLSVFELGTIEEEDGKSSFVEDENEVVFIPAGAIAYREGTGWVYPVGWKPAPTAPTTNN